MKRINANHYQTSERYYKIPKLLFESDRYKDMKLEVKVAYAVLKDRLELSLSKGWIDEEGAIYLVYSNAKLMNLLGCSKSKLLSIKKRLDSFSDFLRQNLLKKDHTNDFLSSWFSLWREQKLEQISRDVYEVLIVARKNNQVTQEHVSILLTCVQDLITEVSKEQSLSSEFREKYIG
ncbi:SAG1252 family conjugative relaxosome accessory protein [Streptococcus moroccensis]|uniref:CopG family antitoxin n=1 Tax=Streptococcus moroccensis TaxID=1451356 RepID=A0ABT9YTZ2_9STRE|nr:putative CopG family antitoxin [Streptococcus moroccensis]